MFVTGVSANKSASTETGRANRDIGPDNDLTTPILSDYVVNAE
jgi:hypothetical protein